MFSTHGEYKLEQKGNIIIINSKGPFNSILVDQYSREINTIIRNLPATWGQIVFVHGEGMLPPDAEQSLQEACLQRKNKGLTASAIIFVASASTFAIRELISRVYEYAGIEYQFFDTYDAAEAWVFKELKIR